MGLNEAAGYLTVAGTALLSGYLAATYGLRPFPFVIGIVCAVLGLLLSVVAVRETREYAHAEAQLHQVQVEFSSLTFGQVIARTSWQDRSLFAVSQAGLVNNLNDALAWGLFPLYFAVAGLSLAQIAVLAAVYPAVWGMGQLGTGVLSDRFGRKRLIAGGMWVQAVGIGIMLLWQGFWIWLGGTVLLGIGTAMVYPTLLAAVGDRAHPSWRASAVGVYRLWRDCGYALGALLVGLLADLLNLEWALGVVGGLTLLSGIIVALTMRETRPQLLQ